MLLFTANVSFKIIEINVMPGRGASVNKSDMCNLTNKLLNIPSRTVHRLRASTSDSFDNLQGIKKNLS